MSITYETISEKPFAIRVRLEGKTVGTIKKDREGFFFYAPKQGTPGESYPTLEVVKRVLERG